MKSDDIMMQPITDLMWTAEEEEDLVLKGSTTSTMKVNCGGGGISCCIACCSVPSFITKWICNS